MANFTPRLNLRKPDPDPVTGDDVDIQEDLNANWDKVDTAVATAQDDIVDLQGDVATVNGQITTINSQISSINSQISSINSQLGQLKPGTCVARLRRNSTSTIAQSTAIPWDAEDWDTLGGHSTSSNTTRYTPNVAGKYQVMAVVQHQAVTAGAAIWCWIAKNGGAATARVNGSANSSPSAGNGLSITDVVICNGTTDYIEVVVGNNQGASVNCAGSTVAITYAGP